MDMNAAVDGLRAQTGNERLAEVKKPSREEAEAAVRTLIAWAGDNPDREGLIDTPGRVVRAYEDSSKATRSTPTRNSPAPSRKSRAIRTW